MDCSTPGFPVHLEFWEFTRTHVRRVGDAIQPSHPLSSPSPPAFHISQHQVFSYDSVLNIRWPKYRSFSFSISASSEYSGLISFRMAWLDLLSALGNLKSPIQHHSSKASIHWHSPLFTVQLSHPYTTSGKTISLTRRTFVSKGMSLLFNALSRFSNKGIIPKPKLKWISLSFALDVSRFVKWIDATVPTTSQGYTENQMRWNCR